MPRYKITLEYCGTHLSGWQVQPDRKTVQGLVEGAISNITGEITRVIGSGRTDSGVHATGQVAHFDITQILPSRNVIRAINHFTHRDSIIIKECSIVSSHFHARHSANTRHYKYQILNRPSMTVLDKDRVLWVREKIDIELLQEALSYLIGTHDFSAFRSSACQAKSPITTLLSADITQDGEYILLYFSGTAFLHHMVRNIVGSVLEVGCGKILPGEILKILNSKARKLAGPTASPYGLYLTAVEY